MNFWNRIAAEKHLLNYPAMPYGPIGMIYPNAYSVGMASLGYQQIYRHFKESGFSVERIFFDKKERETRSVENHTPLFRFPILTCSYTYELDILNLIKMMVRGGVEPLSENRGEDSPILIMGGQAATSNPNLLNRIADVVVLGEGETVVQQIAQCLSEYENSSRQSCLEALSNLPYTYVPSIHQHFDRDQFPKHSLEPIDTYPCHTVIQAEHDEFGGAFLLEMSRGCHYRCKFCIVHYMNGMARYRNYDLLIDVLEHHKDNFQKVGLLGAAVADHPRVEDISEWLVQHGKQVSTSSLRAEKISERFLDLLRDGGQHTITVAPETGATESRKRMRKGVKDEKYLRLAEMAGSRGFPRLKLYFLIGVPASDPMQEADEIINFCQKINNVFQQSGGGQLIATVSPFVPKPTTPWEEEHLWDAKSIKKASRIIRKHLTFRGNIKVRSVNVKEAKVETVLTWAGDEITDELVQLAMGDLPIESAFKDFDLRRIQKQELVV